MDTFRCCLLCGRWGTRNYRAAWSSDGVTGEGYVCTNDRACARRAACVASRVMQQ